MSFRPKSPPRSPLYVLLLILLLLAAQPWAIAAPTHDFGLDLHGKPLHQLAGPGVRVVVLVFTDCDCPISSRYVPEVIRLAREFSTQGVRFWWVYPNPGATPAVVEKHNRDFSITPDSDVSTVLDPRQSLVDLAHATITPEAAIFLVKGAQLREVYHGRIDDRYIAIGEERPWAQHHDLEIAIAAAVAGKPVPQPAGPPVGCSIIFLQK